MPERRVFHKEIGAYFREIREARGLGLRQAADVAERRGLAEITRDSLFRLEKGRTKDVTPELLREVAKLYSVSYEDVGTEFLKHRYGIDLRRDLSSPDPAVRSAHTSKDVADPPVSSEVPRGRRASVSDTQTLMALAVRLITLSEELALVAQDTLHAAAVGGLDADLGLDQTERDGGARKRGKKAS